MDGNKLSLSKLKRIIDEMNKRKDTKLKRIQVAVTKDTVRDKGIGNISSCEFDDVEGNTSGCGDWNCGDEVAGNVSSCDAIWCDPPPDEEPFETEGNVSACSDWICDDGDL